MVERFSCQMLVTGSEALNVELGATEDGVVISLVRDDVTRQTELSSLVSSAPPRAVDRVLGCFCLRRAIEGACYPSLLRFDDLLGATVDREKRALSFVYFPKNGTRSSDNSRARRDVVMHLVDYTRNNEDCIGDEEYYARATAFAKVVSHRCCLMLPGGMNLLVLVNPNSGSGNAQANWLKVRAIWDDLPWITYEEVLTSRAGEGYECAQRADATRINGIVIVSGDGLVHEVFNGLVSRTDTETALARIPVGHIPGGSGNGLAKSILDACDEDYGVVEAGFLIAKGGVQRIHLMSVNIPTQPQRVSFLSLSAAVIADIDLRSESLRFLGGLRFTVYALACLVSPTVLNAELTYWPVEASNDSEAFVVSSRPSQPAPGIDDPLPKGPWKVIDDDFTIFWGSNAAWCSSSDHVAPGLSFGSDCWNLVITRNIGRVSLAKVLLGFESGSHVAEPVVEVIQCYAFRLKPRSRRGLLSLDGEAVPLGPLQMWPSPLKASVLGAKPSQSVV